MSPQRPTSPDAKSPGSGNLTRSVQPQVPCRVPAGSRCSGSACWGGVGSSCPEAVVTREHLPRAQEGKT